MAQNKDNDGHVRGTAFAPNSPHKKYIFGRLNRCYIEPEKAVNIMEDDLAPLADIYSEMIDKAQYYASTGNAQKFNSYLKRAMLVCEDYNTVLDMLVHSENYGATPDEWEENYERLMVEIDPQYHENKGPTLNDKYMVSAAQFGVDTYPPEIKEIILEQINDLNDELMDKENGHVPLDWIQNYNSIVGTAYGDGYQGSNDNPVEQQMREVLAERHEELESAKRSLEQNREFMEKNRRRWEEYDAVHGVHKSWWQRHVEKRQAQRDILENERKLHELLNNPFDVRHEANRVMEEMDEFERQEKEHAEADGRSDGRSDGRDGGRDGGRDDGKRSEGRDDGRSEGRSSEGRDEEKRDGNRFEGTNRSFGRRLYDRWHSVPIVGQALSPVSHYRKRIGPFYISTGFGGMRHPLDFISNVSIKIGAVSYSIYSRDKTPGISHINLPGGIDLRGNRKKKDSNKPPLWSRIFGRTRNKDGVR